MNKKFITLGMVIVLVLAVVTPVAAITGGQLDGNGHPFSGLVLVPGLGACSGTLVDEDLVLTAGHCTSFFSDPAYGIQEVWVTFDPQAAVDLDTWEVLPGQGNWHLSHAWVTHPGYVDANWPFTSDYGLVFLDEPVVGISPAVLPQAGFLAQLIGTTGQTGERFYDVGYGQNGVINGGGPPVSNFDFVRKISEQRYNPSKGAVGTQDPTWLTLGNVPSEQHGSGCGGDSGSGIFLDPAGALRNTVVAVHTGGYRLGYQGNLCGRITSLNHRVDIPLVLDWLADYLD